MISETLYLQRASESQRLTRTVRERLFLRLRAPVQDQGDWGAAGGFQLLIEQETAVAGDRVLLSVRAGAGRKPRRKEGNRRGG